MSLLCRLALSIVHIFVEVHVEDLVLVIKVTMYLLSTSVEMYELESTRKRAQVAIDTEGEEQPLKER